MKRLMIFLVLTTSLTLASDKISCQCNEIAKDGLGVNKDKLELTFFEATQSGDPFDDNVGYIVSAADTHNSYSDASVFIRTRGDKLQFGVHWGRYVGKNGLARRVSVRFDQGEIWMMYVNPSSQGNASFFMQPCFMASKIMGNAQLAVRITDWTDAQRTVVVDLAEIRQHLVNIEYQKDIPDG